MLYTVEALSSRVLLSAVLDPSADEQEMFEWLNRLRMDPQAHLYEMVDSTSPLHSSDAYIQTGITYWKVDGPTLKAQWDLLRPVAPLAWNADIAEASRAHSQLMAASNDQQHQFPGEADIGDRLTAAGYTNWWTIAENVFAYGKTLFGAHAAFAIDWGVSPTGIQNPPGHRDNMMDPIFREVGIGIINETDPATRVGNLVITQDFGVRSGVSGAWLLGVAYSDTTGNGHYTAGEGLGGVTVQISKGGVPVQTLTTMTAGGYQALLQPGVYSVTFSGGALAAPVTRSVTVGADNVKLDHVAATPLVVDGTAAVDTISLALSGSDLLITRNGVSTTRSLASVSQITINGLAGSDRITVGAGIMGVSINGGDGDDLITGGSGADRIYGGGGNDTISSGLGPDTVLGNFGNDLIYAGSGDDQLQGGLGADSLHGDAGRDSILGGDQPDLIYGGIDSDYIEGKGKADTVYAGGGNDTIIGGAGNDSVFGEAGDDWLYGEDTQVFIDTMSGGDGVDRYAADQTDVLSGMESNLLG